MSARRHEPTVSTAITSLLQALTAAEPGAPACDRIPGDFAAPVQPVGRIHATVDSVGTVPVADLPAALRKVTRSRRRDLLGIAWSLTALANEGRAALRVPEAFLSDATQGHVDLRQQLVEGGRLHGVIRLAPDRGRSRAAIVVLLLGPADVSSAVWFGGTDAPLDPAPAPGTDAPEWLAHWHGRHDGEHADTRQDESFLVPRMEIAATGFDLTPARYRADDAPTDEVQPRRPHEILAELAGLEQEILQGIGALAGLLRP